MIFIYVYSRIIPTCSTRWFIMTARTNSLASRCASATLSSSGSGISKGMPVSRKSEWSRESRKPSSMVSHWSRNLR